MNEDKAVKEDPALVQVAQRMDRAIEDLFKIENSIRNKLGDIMLFEPSDTKPAEEAMKPSFAVGHLWHNVELIEQPNTRLDSLLQHLSKII